TGNTTATSPIVTAIPSTTGMVAGMPISGTNIPAATTILSVDSATQIHLSQNATGSGTGVAIQVCPYGVGDGSTTFALPDFRGRVPVGAGQGTSLTNRVLGASGGEEAHVLTAAELASHTHAETTTVSNPCGTLDGPAR